jgi:alkylhydroperoxidase/carboxymuconolactone decarboxylase family protein YurZ
MDEREDMLRSLVLHDDSVVASVLAMGVDTWDPSPIDAKTSALVRLGALIALDAPVVSYQSCITMALAAGATADDIVDTLMAVAPIAGGVRVVAAAPALALAIGYDIDAALEAHDTATAVRDEDP